MQLVVHELQVLGVKQLVTATKNDSIVAVRPHLLKFGSPAGSLKLQLLDANSKIISESVSITIASISSQAYFHGYVTFDFAFNVMAGQNYYIKLLGVGYTFSEGDYIGWCNDYDLRKYDATYIKNNGFYAALDVEFWDRG